jgi:hypothetical protein
MTATTDSTRDPSRPQSGTDEIPVKDEIAALEQQILYRRERLKARSYALEYQVRKRVASPYTLILAVAAGFVGERLLRNKLNPPSSGYQSHQPQGKPKDEGIINQALKAVAIVQGIMASPVVGMLRQYFDEQKAKATHQPTPDQQTALKRQSSANGPGSSYYH